MTTNPYFRNFTSENEQNLFEDLIIESIKIHGIDVYYVNRNVNRYDDLYGEDDISSYDHALMIEMYIRSVNGFSGDGQFMSKFGLQIRDQIIFSVSQRVFTSEIGTILEKNRPMEGDLIFFPFNKKCFRIMFVNQLESFYQIGSLKTWEITCELFEYSNEKFNTGIEDIDRIERDYNINTLIRGDDMAIQEYDQAALNDVIQDGTENYPMGSDDILDFSEINPITGKTY